LDACHHNEGLEFFMNMQNTIKWSALLATSTLFFWGCIGQDEAEPTHINEATTALCQDGKDNDGDGNYDCYDSECRSLDSAIRAANGTAICSRDLSTTIIPQSSSAEEVSSSTEVLSSSSSAPADTAFPLALDGSASLPSAQITGLAYDAADDLLGVVGKQGQGLFMAIIDPATGNVLQSKNMLESELSNYSTQVANYGEWNGSSWAYDLHLGIDGNFYGVGWSEYASGKMAKLFRFAADNTPIVTNVSGILAVPSESRAAMVLDNGVFWTYLDGGTNTYSLLYPNASGGYDVLGSLGAGASYIDMEIANEGGVVAVGSQVVDASTTNLVFARMSAEGALAINTNPDGGGAQNVASDVLATENAYLVAYSADGVPFVAEIAANGTVNNTLSLAGLTSIKRLAALSDGRYIALGKVDGDVAYKVFAADLSAAEVEVTVAAADVAGDIVEAGAANVVIGAYNNDGTGWIQQVNP
jgi:hypothetical protein